MDHTQTLNAQWPAQDCQTGPAGTSQPDARRFKLSPLQQAESTDTCFDPRPTQHTYRRYSLSSSSGSDTSDQSEAFSQASDSTAITEPDYQLADDGSVLATPASDSSFTRSSGIFTFGPTAVHDSQFSHSAAKAAVHSKLAALDRSGEQRIAASRLRSRFAIEAGGALPTAAVTDASSVARNCGYAPNVPIGRHRCALSSVDSILQTRSQRFPVQRCSSAARPQELLSTSGPYTSLPKNNVAPHPRRSAPGTSWSAPTARKSSLVETHPASLDARKSALSQSWSPPSLVREEDRRKVMVEQLVGMNVELQDPPNSLLILPSETASQLISAIWPGSVSVPEATQGIVISLSFFVRETLRRSRTSYNSLQVALYYIVKLRAKGQLPICSSTNDKNKEGHALRAMRCGRRMLLTSLILASKYLQDRNFSARAWSKISGLPVEEITSNEMAVLKVLDWKLHITESDFAHWSTVVHKSTELLKETGNCKPLWQQVIKLHRDGASIEALALAMRPTQQMQVSPLRDLPEASLPSPTSSVDSFRGFEDGQVQPFVVSPHSRAPGRASDTVGFAHGMLATPASSPPRGLSVRTSGLPPCAPRLGATLSTPSFTPLGSSQASTPAVLTGARQTGVGMKAVGGTSGLTESWMPSPVSLQYGSDDESDAALYLSKAVVAGSKRRADSTDSDELMAGASPPKVSRRC